MNILILGSGGREHALAWKIAQSPLCHRLYCAPANAGISELAEIAACDADDASSVIDFCQKENIEFVIIGPEIPLVNGMADALTAANIAVFGPSAAAAQLEGSKGFTKDICAAANIPTAAYARFFDAAAAHEYLTTHATPIVIKADGLAAGKGVIIAQTDTQAHDAVDMIFDGGFGAAGASLVIEDFMQGEEVSFFALCDGKTALPLATAQDHKQVGEGDTGLNTGGMGAYSPAPIMTAELADEVMTRIINPTLHHMAAQNMPFKGVLYAGLMLTAEGPKLVEYNVRFGDPECQVLMARLNDDIVPALWAVAQGDISHITLDWADDKVITVIMAAQGYPEAYQKNTEIRNLQAAAMDEAVTIFHAGTKYENDRLLAAGGRVLNITARGDSITEAAEKAYSAIAKIDWPQGFYRRDIGWRAIAREKSEH